MADRRRVVGRGDALADEGVRVLVFHVLRGKIADRLPFVLVPLLRAARPREERRVVRVLTQTQSESDEHAARQPPEELRPRDPIDLRFRVGKHALRE